jgi:hypothetical protein
MSIGVAPVLERRTGDQPEQVPRAPVLICSPRPLGELRQPRPGRGPFREGVIHIRLRKCNPGAGNRRLRGRVMRGRVTPYPRTGAEPTSRRSREYARPPPQPICQRGGHHACQAWIPRSLVHRQRSLLRGGGSPRSSCDCRRDRDRDEPARGGVARPRRRRRRLLRRQGQPSADWPDSFAGAAELGGRGQRRRRSLPRSTGLGRKRPHPGLRWRHACGEDPGSSY